MIAREAKLLDFLKKSPQFVIPIYQRTYSWTEYECQQFWEDILRAGRSDDVSAHFIGSIVYVEKGLYSVSSQSPLLVIDGQQRLTTVTLLIEALARAVDGGEPLEGFSAKNLRNYYLQDPREDGDRRYKLILSQTDKQSLTNLIDQLGPPAENSIRIEENFALFQALLSSRQDDLDVICKGLAKLMVVDISLDRDQDNPQLIFESMNSTGRELSQADLIRNYVLMGLEPQLQTQLYQHYWRPMEVAFGQEAYATHFDTFMRHYLTVKTGDIPNVNKVYEAFKIYSRTSKAGGVEQLVADMRSFAGYYCAMVFSAETDKDLKAVFHDIRELKVEVAYPLLLELYHDYQNQILAKDELIQAARLIESYVFRRAVCSIPTNSMNRTFARFGRDLKKDRYFESLQAHFVLLPSYRRFPNDEEFKRELKIKDLYNFRSCSYWLRRMENYGRKERVPVDDYTIEHIMPQNPNLSDEWKSDLGPDWERVQQTYLHTLGNLTLTGYNSEYSDRPFAEKRDMSGGFAHSPLKMNQGLGILDSWNEGTITERAERLAMEAAGVWASPQLDGSIMEKYKPQSTAVGYSIDDHPHLASSGIARDLFEAFRRHVTALDPCVSEEFLKLYVAYKAETNFVDVIPQTKRLRLSLNIKIHEINDPRELCKDVANLSRWGNGHVEVLLTSFEELPYIVGLVRQAFEKQIGNGA